MGTRCRPSDAPFWRTWSASQAPTVRTFFACRSCRSGRCRGSSVPDRRCQDAELLRAAVFADAFAEPGDVLVIAGDFNVVIGESETLERLASPDWGFSDPIPGLDQILVRGAMSTRPERWPDERRRFSGRLLSDHAPVETRIE